MDKQGRIEVMPEESSKEQKKESDSDDDEGKLALERDVKLCSLQLYPRRSKRAPKAM